jgi:two-component system sensor histidine kinase GlrK
MTVARRLQYGLLVFVALVAGLSAVHVHAIRSAMESTRRLTEMSSRLRTTSSEQVSRVSQMSEAAEKFLITRDTAYLAHAAVTARDFGREVGALRSLPLSRAERSALVRLGIEWREVEPMAAGLAALPNRSVSTIGLTVQRFQAALDGILARTIELGVASQTAMTEELRAVEATARTTERLSMTATVAALILMVLLSTVLVRSIVKPLDRLTTGVRGVADGRFDYRLDATGDDELANVAREFNAMTARLGELDQLKRHFVANVSHDLKTPLSSMQETTSALLDGVAGPVNEAQSRLLRLNLESSQRLSRMLGKMLELSRVEARLQSGNQEVQLDRLVKVVVDRISPSLPGSQQRVVVDVSGAVIRGNAQALEHVVENLLENALKFSAAPAPVFVRVECLSNGVLLSVADSGPGIADSEKHRVFDRFYQASAGRVLGTRGAGLGLAICLETVKAHGGRIWVSDNAPQGSVFWVLLPGSPGSAADIAAKAAA